MRSVLARSALLVGLVSPTLVAQGLQSKYLHNDNKTLQGIRASTDKKDTLFFLPPPSFHAGYGKVHGWIVGLHDADASSSETISLGFVGIDTRTGRPDPGTRHGTKVSFSISGTATGPQTRIWLLSLANGNPKQNPLNLPRRFALELELPKPAPQGKTWKDVALTALFQDGKAIKLPSGVPSTQMLFHLDAQGKVQGMGNTGSTILIGPTFLEPGLQVYASSKAYGGQNAENLFGPEALYPDPKRGDRTGMLFSYKSFKLRSGAQYVIPLLAPATLATNIQTPYGDLILVPSLLALPPLLVDLAGSADSGPIPIPSGARFWTQGLFYDPLKNEARLSCAQEVLAQ